MKTFDERQNWALSACRRAQMRLTPVRGAILRFLAQRRLPASMEMITQAEGVRGECDMTTVFRTLMLFKEAELIRLVSLPRKSSCFVLNVPGENAHFLICRRCGCVTETTLPGSVLEEIEQVALRHGFCPAPPDCEIHGLCEACQTALKGQTVPSKLSCGCSSSTRRKSQANSFLKP